MKKTSTPKYNVTRTGKSEDKLSIEQKAYADLLKKIEKQEKKNIAAAKKVNEIREAHAELIMNNLNKHSQTQLDLAVAIGKAAQTQKLTKAEKGKLRDAILYLLGAAKENIDLEQEHIALFNEWSEQTYEEIEKEEEEEEKAELLEELKNLGIHVELEESDTFEQAKAKIFAKVMEKKKEIEEGEFTEQESPKSFNNRPKTKKQLEKEAKLLAEQKAAEELRGKTIRSIYIGLAKVLHPDTASDLLEKNQKEELMKQVTVAYEKKDLPTLLKLEAKWVEGQSQEVGKLTNDKIRIYISFLNERLASLIQEEREILSHPSNQQIWEYLNMAPKKALSELEKESGQILYAINRLQSMTQIKPTKISLMSVVKEVLEDSRDTDINFEMFEAMFRDAFFR